MARCPNAMGAKHKPTVDAARDVLQKASNAVGSATLEVNGVVAGYFYPREAPAYDSRKLEELLPGDILRQCLAANQQPKQPPFWVRLARR